jgi:hypothetical protein
MRNGVGIATLLGLWLSLAISPSAASAARTYECQKPVMTGVEVSGLHDITVAKACPPALALFAWENSRVSHANELYGCHRKSPNQAGYPYLKLHRFDGYELSLVGKPYGLFTMSRGSSSFHVGGTDFPLNCT